MKKIKEVIVVEGRYDKNTLSQVVDARIIPVGGFSIFNQKETLTLLRRLARERGLIILTDSDGAGFLIRNFLKGALPAGQVKQAYIPDVYGKERRKRTAGKEGKLGVEGMKPEVLLKALRRAGATFEQEKETQKGSGVPLTKADLFVWGLTGRSDSKKRREMILRELNLPEHLTTNALMEVVNMLYSREKFIEILEKLNDSW